MNILVYEAIYRVDILLLSYRNADPNFFELMTLYYTCLLLTIESNLPVPNIGKENDTREDQRLIHTKIFSI